VAPFQNSANLESNIESKWKQVGDAALAGWNLALAEEAFKKAKDLGSLLLLFTSTGSREGLELLTKMAQEACQNNIAFTCQLALGNVAHCIEILTSTGRCSEAVLFSKTYKPSLTAELVKQWKGELVKNGKEKIAKSIASPDGNLELFPQWPEHLQAEENVLQNGNVAKGITCL
jgi:coatomer subunit beta'